MNTTLLLVSVLFLIGFVSDLIAQQLGRFSDKVNLFAPFWEHYGPIRAAVIAGIITLIFGGLFLTIAMGIYQYLGLKVKSWSFVLFSAALAFVLGVVFDVWSNYGNWLGSSLRKWYDAMGATNAAMWGGGLTFAFTAFIASTILKLSP